MKKTEQLYTCPECGQAGFTQAGLTAHKKTNRCKASAKAGKADAKGSAKSVVTLERLEQMHSGTEIAIAEMSLEQASTAAIALEKFQQGSAAANGVAATLCGLVLLRVKALAGHGNFRPWIKEHFPASYDTANKYMAFARAYKADEYKVPAPPESEVLESDVTNTLALFQARQLDRGNPLVRAVAKWTGGRSMYQLLKDIGDAADEGDDEPPTPPRRKSIEETMMAVKANVEKEAKRYFASDLTAKRLWQMLDKQEVEQMAVILAGQVREMRAWLKDPKQPTPKEFFQAFGYEDENEA